METADLSGRGERRLEMKGDQETPASRVFRKPTYLNIYGSSVEAGAIQMQSDPRHCGGSLSLRKLFIVVSGRITSLWVAETFDIAGFLFPAETTTVPVLVRGLEKSCCKSLFSVVLRTTTMSAGRVSRFFSRNPFTLYMTCGVGRSTVNTGRPSRAAQSSSSMGSVRRLSYLSCVMLNSEAKLHAFRYPEIFAAQIVFKFIWR